MILIEFNRIAENGFTVGYPLSHAGLQAGDEIIELNGSSIHSIRELSLHLQLHPVTEEPVMITYLRNGKKNTAEIIPVFDEESRQYRVGISLTSVREKTNFFGILRYSGREVRFWIVSTVEGLTQLVKGQVKVDDLAGPVGIVDMIGTTYSQSKQVSATNAFFSMINISILLSANLGVINLLPIPALDGGRLIFLVIEAIRKKPMDQRKEALIHVIGFVALMALMILVLYNDIRKIL